MFDITPFKDPSYQYSFLDISGLREGGSCTMKSKGMITRNREKLIDSKRQEAFQNISQDKSHKISCFNNFKEEVSEIQNLHTPSFRPNMEFCPQSQNEQKEENDIRIKESQQFKNKLSILEDLASKIKTEKRFKVIDLKEYQSIPLSEAKAIHQNVEPFNISKEELDKNVLTKRKRKYVRRKEKNTKKKMKKRTTNLESPVTGINENNKNFQGNNQRNNIKIKDKKANSEIFPVENAN